MSDEEEKAILNIIEHIQDNYIVNYTIDCQIVTDYTRLKEFLKFLKNGNNYHDEILLVDYCNDNMDIVESLIDERYTTIRPIESIYGTLFLKAVLPGVSGSCWPRRGPIWIAIYGGPDGTAFQCHWIWKTRGLVGLTVKLHTDH